MNKVQVKVVTENEREHIVESESMEKFDEDMKYGGDLMFLTTTEGLRIKASKIVEFSLYTGGALNVK